MANTEIKRGQAITFRIPSDTPDHLLKQLQRLKETERRNFSSKMAEYVLEGVNQSLTKDKEALTIPLPKMLSQSQRNWVKHEHSEALLGTIMYQLIADPVRSASLLASLNSDALDIDEALYLQEQPESAPLEQQVKHQDEKVEIESEEPQVDQPLGDIEDDLANFDWNEAQKQVASSEEETEEKEEESTEDLLGGFLSRMNQ
ncbi:hypothetical protein [Tuberibacillus sp. Marseille-P3662]|uniref:hypothetical protein n=1 Tax=Tuberibacillus sp. Marseille-P3662 TaxID=1965358 RepID=UPI000A1CBF1C|nr:hypothetical protein [Tuberibacillus sp. Marseille-P3662]